jgi:copper chaperone
MTEKVLDVRGMTCNHCKASVTSALTQLAGVSRVEVDLPTGRVQVEYDAARLDESALRRAIEDVGFDVG